MPVKTRSRKKAPKAPTVAAEEPAPVAKRPVSPSTQTSQSEKQYSKRKRSPSTERSSETPSSSTRPHKYRAIEGPLPTHGSIIGSHLNIYEQAVQAVLEDSQRFGEISKELDVAAIAAPVAMSLDAHFRILIEQKVDSVYNELDKLKERSVFTDQMNRRLIRQNYELTKKLGKYHGWYFDDESLFSISSSGGGDGGDGGDESNENNDSDESDESDDSNNSSDGSDN